MKSVHVAATGSYLPGDPITNEELEQYAGGLPDDVLEGLQVKTRHWIADPRTGEQSETNAEMATKAAREALSRAGIEPEEVELLVLSTASPDYHLPPMVTFVQDALGLERCATVEIRSGCAGAIEALDLARMYLERGQYTNGRRDRQRGDLAAARPDLRRPGSGQGADARQARASTASATAPARSC